MFFIQYKAISPRCNRRGVADFRGSGESEGDPGEGGIVGGLAREGEEGEEGKGGAERPGDQAEAVAGDGEPGEEERPRPVAGESALGPVDLVLPHPEETPRRGAPSPEPDAVRGARPQAV